MAQLFVHLLKYFRLYVSHFVTRADGNDDAEVVP